MHRKKQNFQAILRLNTGVQIEGPYADETALAFARMCYKTPDLVMAYAGSEEVRGLFVQAQHEIERGTGNTVQIDGAVASLILKRIDGHNRSSSLLLNNG